MEGGTPVATVSNRETTVDPDLIDGFVTAVIIFAKTPIRTIRKAAYDIIIEVGESYLLLCVLDPVPDEAPYREPMKKVLEFAEMFSRGWVKPPHVHEIASQLASQNPKWMHYHLLQCILSSLDMSWMGFLDGNPNEHLGFILPRLEQPQGRDEIYDYVTEKICEQIDAGGTSIGIDIDQMIQHADLAVRVEKVLNQRRREVENAEIVVNGNSVNLKNFLLTAYGFRIHQGGLEPGVSCDLQTFNKMQQELGQYGITLKTNTHTSQNGIAEVSMGMSDYIWTIIRDKLNSSSSLSSTLIERFIKSIVVRAINTQFNIHT
jgi:hypothetical protein